MESSGSASRSLVWSKLPNRSPREYTLKEGDTIVARLTWQKQLGSLAVGESAHGSWSFKRTGFLASRLTVRNTGSNEDLVEFRPFLSGGGKLKMRDGRSWELKAQGLFSQSYVMLDELYRQVLSLNVNGMDPRGELSFGPAKPDERTAHLLAMLCWYVAMLSSDDAETVSLLTILIS